jgi:hypothetical protein
MSIKVKVSGVNAIIQGLDRFEDEIQLAVQDEIHDWAKRVEADAQRDTPVDTGKLKGSIRAILGANGLTWIVKVGGINGVNYAPYVVFGTGSFVDQNFLQQFGLVQYANQFKGKGQREVNLPMRDFLYRNARLEFDKSLQEIKKILAKSRI